MVRAGALDDQERKLFICILSGTLYIILKMQSKITSHAMHFKYVQANYTHSASVFSKKYTYGLQISQI